MSKRPEQDHPSDDSISPRLQQRARMHLDAASDNLDLATRDALAAARKRARMGAAQDKTSPRVALGWLGAGSLVAASLAAFLFLPLQPGNTGGESVISDPDLLLVSDADAALADDLAFVAWLDENHETT